MAVWLFLGWEHTAGGESRSLQGEGGFGGPLQVGFGQPGFLVRFFGLLAVAGRCVGCFALLVSPWLSCPTGHFSPLGTNPLSTLNPQWGCSQTPHQSPTFGSTNGRSLLWGHCWNGPRWKASSAWCHQFCSWGSSSSWVKLLRVLAA